MGTEFTLRRNPSPLASLIPPTARTGAKRKLLQLTWHRRIPTLSLHALLTTLGAMVRLLMVAEKTPPQLMTGEHQITLRRGEDPTASPLPERRLIPCLVVMGATALGI